MTSITECKASVIVAILAVLLTAGLVLAEEMRTIRVAAQVIEDGAGVPDIPIIVTSSLGGVGAGVTGPQGDVAIEAQVPLSDTIVVVRISHGDEPPLPPAERRRLAYQTRVWLDARCPTMWVVAPLRLEQDSYDVSLMVDECVHITARLMIQGIAASEQVLMRADSWIADAASILAHASARRNASTRLVLSGSGLGCIIPLSQVQTSQSGSIGDIVAPWGDADAFVDVAPSHWNEYDQTTDSAAIESVSLVRSDGSFFISAFETRLTPDAAGGSNLVVDRLHVPHGEYFVVPGAFMGLPEQLELLDAIERGQEIPPEIPRVAVEAGQTASVSIDLYAAHRALFRLRPPPAPGR